MPKLVLTAALALVMAGLLTASVPLSSAPRSLPGQSDLDAFMQKVVARRDENWKKLQQYVLDETEVVLTLETRDPDQRRLAVDRLRADGLRVDLLG